MAPDTIPNIPNNLWLTAAEECKSHALSGTQSAFVDQFRNMTTSNSRASSRASSLAPSKSLAVSSGTLTPRAPPNRESTNTSFFAESLWSTSAGEAQAEVESEDGDGTAEDSSSDNESSDSNEGSDGDDVAEEPEVGKGKQRHDPYADWDNGEPLTPEERTQIMKLSTYERAREMNIRRRKRMEVSLQSEFRALTGDLKKTPPRSLPASSGKRVPDGPTRRSSRNKAAE
jgi:hypothetical protein